MDGSMGEVQPRPPRLYHYTGSEGLLGILRDGTLHATDLRFVNDRTEYQHAVDVAARLVSGERDGEDRLLFECIQELLKDSTEYMTGPVFIASFSECGDDLNQWRAYSYGGTGFCIGFDSRKLIEGVGESWRLSPCIYEDSAKDAMIVQRLSDTIRQRKAKEWPLDDSYVAEKLADLFVEELSEVAPVLKDQAFASENEWRLWRAYSPDALHWRVGKHVPVPFAKVPYRVDVPRQVQSVRIGPTADYQLARLSVSGLLNDTFGPDHGIEVLASEVPYRG